MLRVFFSRTEKAKEIMFMGGYLTSLWIDTLISQNRW